jgi:hypothetical protein
MTVRCPTQLRCWLTVALATACTRPDIEAPSWDPLELDEVRAALQEPTGQLADVDEAALEDALSDVAPVLIDVAQYFATVAQIVAEVSEQQDPPRDDAGMDAGTPVSGRGSAVGAQLFLALACPGTALDPPFSFDHGEVRIDSPVLDALSDVPTLLSGADLLVSFRRCELGEILLEGEAPALFTLELEDLGDASSPEPQSFSVALDFVGLEYSDGALPLGVMAFGCDGVSSCGERQAVSAQLLAGELGSYTLSFVLTSDFGQSPTTLTLGLTAADGEAQCQFDSATQRVTCATR